MCVRKIFKILRKFFFYKKNQVRTRYTVVAAVTPKDGSVLY